MKKILLCDDDFIIIKLIENKLKADGYEVLIATDGNKAIDTIKTHELDLIITDMHMPFVTGMEIVDFVRNDRKSTTPIIIVTKDASDDTKEDAYNVGVDDYLNKPVNMNILSVKVSRLLK